MQLLGLIEAYSDVLDWTGGSVEIDGITPDASRALPGYLFVALSGIGVDSHGRLHETLRKGAVAVLGEWHLEDLAENLPWGASTYVRVPDPVQAWFWLCKNWKGLCKLGVEPAY
jgi:UDP-N-acetylmuramyl tripeptide synthase